MSRFQGRTILVTGAASGMGMECVRRLSAEGATVLAIDLSHEPPSGVIQDTPDPSGIHKLVLDVTDHDGTALRVEALAQRFEDMHGLVNCAGVRGIGTLLDCTSADWKRVLAVNLEGTFNMCQAFARALTRRKRGGVIVNVGSTAGIRAVPNRIAYVAAKFGVTGMTQAMAVELGPLGIRVNAVAPGLIRTPMVTSTLANPAVLEGIRATYPLQRFGEPEEVVAVIAFLLSEEAAFMTGAIVPVDGGNTAGKPSH